MDKGVNLTNLAVVEKEVEIQLSSNVVSVNPKTHQGSLMFTTKRLPQNLNLISEGEQKVLVCFSVVHLQ